MSSFHPLLVTGVASSVAVLLVVKFFRFIIATHRTASFPPGPPTLSGLGNILDMPSIKPFLKYEEWSKQYGSILGLKVGAVNLVILHDPEHARELFARRGSLYGFRNMGYIPIKYVMSGINQDRHILNMQPGPHLRLMRSLSVSFFGTSSNSKVLPLVDATSASLAHKLLDTPGSHPVEPFQYWALATPLIAISGERLEHRDKTFIDRFFHAQHSWLFILGPGNTPPVDVLPFLQWIPAKYAKWKRQAKEVRDYMDEEYASLLVAAKKIHNRTKGRSGAHNFDAIMIKLLKEESSKQEKHVNLNDDDLTYLGGGLLDAAVDTTYATIRSVLLLLAAHPECQAKAAEEVQRLCPHAPPSGQDLSRLEYTRACILEVWRLRPPTPLVLPRILERDDTFLNYTIPKGTVVVMNAWAMHRDPKVFPKPDTFRPERFLELGEDGKRKALYLFGIGSRMCPGDQFAQTSILLTVAKVLWSYEIVPTEPLDFSIRTGYQDGLVSSPRSVPVEFKLREGDKRFHIVQDFERSQSVLEHMGL